MKKPLPFLTPRIISDMRPGDERGDTDYPGLRVRRTNAARVFFHRYRSLDGALREIKLGEFGAMTLAEARKALGRLKLDREKGIDPIEVAWTVHDLRRTVATGLAKLGCSRVVQDRILNHVDSSVSAIYDRHRYDVEARAWLQKWADYLESLSVCNVVPLRAA
jgi:integrase